MPPQDQVYLNYRADLRTNFVSHLNRALVSENINVSWDGGEENKYLTVEETLRSIEESRIALAIFSPRYTESKWCIKELDLITDCTVKGSLVTIPIFYKVEPAKVKFLEGDFGNKFKRLADGNVMEKKWAAAFEFVSNITGITVDGKSDESKMIDRIVMEVKRVLKQIPSEESQEASSVDPSENIDTGKYGIKQHLKVCSVSTVKEMPPQDQVYLNYRADLRRNFVSHLNRALVSENINVSWDGGEENKNLTVEETLRSIEESRIALAIFSPKYTESEWCIKELDRIMDCTDKGSLVTIPIFYKVDPSKVKFLAGDFGHKFKRCANGNVMEKKWAAAFKSVSNMTGIIVDGRSDESKMIDRIVTDVKRELKQIPSKERQEASSVDPSENIDTGKYGIKQRLKVFVEKMDLNKIKSQLGMIIACLLLLFLCFKHIVYTTTPLLGEGSSDIDKIVGIPKVVEYNPAERTKITIDKDSDFPTGKYGAKPVRSSSSDATTNADLLDRKDKTFGIKQHLKELGEKLDLFNIACLLLLFFCLRYITYAFITLLGKGRGAIDRNVVDVPKVLKYITCGAKPVRSSLSDAKTNADLHDRTVINSLMDSKIIPPQFQVFISFRGVQLRNNLVGYLVHELQKREVNVFIDNHEQRGEDLNTLFKRIEDSGIAIVVFSTRYTESKWCLEELVKIKERVHQGLLTVLPIFYKVSPTDVKRLKGEFGDHFRDQEYTYKSDELKIKQWKEAILFVSHKFALTFDEQSGALEIDFVETIVKEVLKILQAISTAESGHSSC